MGQYKDAPDVRNSKKFKDLTKEIQLLNTKLAELIVQRTEVYESQKVYCPHCEKSSKISDLVLIDHYRYHKSYSSYEDSSWDFTGGRSTFCPHCLKQYGFNNDWLKEFEQYFADYCGRIGTTPIKLRYYEYYYEMRQPEGLHTYSYSSDYYSTRDNKIEPEKIYEHIQENRKNAAERAKLDADTANAPKKKESVVVVV